MCRTNSEWQPIETAPYGDVLCWVPMPNGPGVCNILYKDGNTDEWYNDDGQLVPPQYQPSHWMPLPAGPPK